LTDAQPVIVRISIAVSSDFFIRHPPVLCSFLHLAAYYGIRRNRLSA
jgi:hypothetical protein